MEIADLAQARAGRIRPGRDSRADKPHGAACSLSSAFGFGAMFLLLRFQPPANPIGFVVYRDFPDGVALTGILITIGAGLFIIHRKQGISRAAAPQPPI